MPGLLRLCLAILLFPLLAGAETTSQRNGTDLFLSGSSGFPVIDGGGDVFATGASVVLKGRTGGDTHVAGFDVSVEAAVAGNLYAAGANVAVLAPVTADLTAMAMTLRLSDKARVAGNARLTGATVVVDGPIGGALTVAAGDMTLNAPVQGDVLLSAETVTFGPEARIAGRLVYSAEAPMAVPDRVIAAERVSFHKRELPPAVTGDDGGWHRMAPMMLPARTVAGGFFLVLAFLIAVGAATLALAPRWSDRIRRTVDARPGACLLSGTLGLAALFGLVPVAAMTLIGLPLLPFVLAAILLGWMMGYLSGVYAMSLRLARAFGIGEAAGLPARILMLALGLLAGSLLNFVPFIGWLLNVTLLLLGLGSILLVALRHPAAARAEGA